MLDMCFSPRTGEPRPSWVATGLALFAVLLFVAGFVRVGADCYWLVALGNSIVASGHVPEGIPFAGAPTESWPNALVLAQLVMAGLHSLGQAALPATQIASDMAVLGLLALGARRANASDLATGLVVLAVAAGSLTSLVIVRLQVLSLVPFALLLLLLRSEHARPTRAIWALPVMVAVWSNLHGAVLVGVVVSGAYLVFSRLAVRPWESVGVGLSSVLALLATPAGGDTLSYYLGVMDNEAAARRTELWARPDLSSPFDALMLISGVVLVALAVRSKRPLWEYVVLAGLAFGTALAARYGVWLLMAAAVPAAAALTPPARPIMASPAAPRGVGVAVLAVAVVAGIVAGVVASTVRGDATLPADPTLVATVARSAGDKVVLAPEPLAESLALAEVRVWVCDPIDAFRKADQQAYLDFLEGRQGGLAALQKSALVVVERGSPSAGLVEASGLFSLEQSVGEWEILSRRGV